MHTPGPWHIQHDAVPHFFVQISVYAETGGERVATVFREEDNARLIAAAPDLLAALNDCITNENCTAIAACDVAYMIRRFKAINKIAQDAIAQSTQPT